MRPTQTTSGSAVASRGSGAGTKRVRSTPLGMTSQRAVIPARSPVARSASLTQTTREAQRAPRRSHSRASRAVGPSTASKDQACGWNTVGTRPRTARRAASPALALCAWTRVGRTCATSRARPRTSRAMPGPGERVACHGRTSQPMRRSDPARGPSGGQATLIRMPAESCASVRSRTTRATPPSTGWVTWRTRGRGGVAVGCMRVSLRDGGGKRARAWRRPLRGARRSRPCPAAMSSGGRAPAPAA